MTDFAPQIQQHLAKASDADMWHAGFCAALDATGDVEQSLDLADQVDQQHASGGGDSTKPSVLPDEASAQNAQMVAPADVADGESTSQPPPEPKPAPDVAKHYAAAWNARGVTPDQLGEDNTELHTVREALAHADGAIQWTGGKWIAKHASADTPEGVSLAARHCPKGYNKARPMQIGGHNYTGGEFIPPEVYAQAPENLKEEIDSGKKEEPKQVIAGKTMEGRKPRWQVEAEEKNRLMREAKQKAAQPQVQPSPR